MAGASSTRTPSSAAILVQPDETCSLESIDPMGEADTMGVGAPMGVAGPGRDGQLLPVGDAASPSGDATSRRRIGIAQQRGAVEEAYVVVPEACDIDNAILCEGDGEAEAEGGGEAEGGEPQ